MPGPTNTLLIEGPFEELAEELAQYLDNLRKNQPDVATKVHDEVVEVLQTRKKDEALKKLVTASAALNSAPEKEFIAAYNLLIHLVRQSPNLNMFLPKICSNLSQPITSSAAHGPSMALSVLTTIFNIMTPDNDARFHMFLAILNVIRAHSLYDSIRPQLKHMDRWISEWESDEEDQRKLYLEIADVAQEAGEDEESYSYLVRALNTFPSSESGSPAARSLSLRALSTALLHPTHFSFHDLTSLDATQALRRSDPLSYELLEIFTAKVLDDYEDFVAEHPSFLTEQSLDNDVLTRKIRLLTLASLAASTSSRALPYSAVAEALRVPAEDVEMWVIDVIRAGLVEGKLSQLNQTFLIHRSTYRVFGEKQWRELDSRLETWKESLHGVLQVVRAGREQVEAERQRESRQIDSGSRANGMAGMNRAGGGGGGGGGNRRNVDVGFD
ncbi:MAG: hypothetical protein M1825_004693 [Sarcosagium campestre]|nr:MAG: hypothetical protein M1825_004693 [Sarcosagium campestre]